MQCPFMGSSGPELLMMRRPPPIVASALTPKTGGCPSVSIMSPVSPARQTVLRDSTVVQSPDNRHRGTYIPVDVTKSVEGYMDLRREIQRLKFQLATSKGTSASPAGSPTKSPLRSTPNGSPQKCVTSEREQGRDQFRGAGAPSKRSGLSAADLLRQRKQAFGMSRFCRRVSGP
jgi:hypothetical protein